MSMIRLLSFLSICFFTTSTCLAKVKAFGSLEFGNSKDLVGRKLKASKLVESKLDDSLLGRTGLNGIYFLKKPVGGLNCSLYFRWTENNTLDELSMQSDSVDAKNFAKARQCWSSFNKVLTKQHGEAKSVGRFPDISELKDGEIQTTHQWKSLDKRTFLLGIGNDQGEYSIAVIIRPAK